jgi:histidine triad (HIT) family protein
MKKPGYDDGNVFARILRGEIPCQKVFEDERCLAFRDLHPQAPVHVLVVPKARIARLGDAGTGDEGVLGHLLWAAGEVARREKLDADGYRVVVNDGAWAGQTVFHLHVHVLGGRAFAWPPG